MAYTITESCIGCGICEDICPERAIKESDETEWFVIITSACNNCAKCVKDCPVQAIIPDS